MSDIEIKSTIPFSMMTRLINSIVYLMYDENGEYLPENYDYVYWVSISNAYAGYGIDVTEDEFMERLYNGYMDMLKSTINKDQLIAINVAVSEKIDYMNRKSPIADAIVRFLDRIGNVNLDELKEIVGNMKNMKENNADILSEA